MRAPFPSEAPACSLWLGLRKSLDRNWGPVCRLGGGGRGWLLWGWVCPFPLPPASYLQRGWAGSSLEFLSPFVLRTTGSVFGRLIFSLAVPQFKRAPSNCSQGFGSVLTLSNATHSSPFYPALLVAGAGVWGTFLLGVAFRHIICGPYLIFPPS